jgi:hypothetical protein
MNQIASQLGEKLHETLEHAEGLSRKAGKQLDEARRFTADALKGSASSVRDANEAIDGLAGRAAATLDSTATYIRRHDSKGMLLDLQQIIWRHPTSLALGAAAAGFLLGLSVRRVSGSSTRNT